MCAPKQEEEDTEGVHKLEGSAPGFVKDGVTYHVGDYVFLYPDLWEALEGAEGEMKELPEYIKKGRLSKVSY